MLAPLIVPPVIGSVIRISPRVGVGFDGLPRVRLAVKRGVKLKGREAEGTARGERLAKATARS